MAQRSRSDESSGIAGRLSELPPAVRLESKPPPTEFCVHGAPSQLERLPPPLAGHLSGGALPGDLRVREDLLQPAQSGDWSSRQVPEGRCDTGDEVPNEDIVKGYQLEKDQFIEVTKEELEEIALEPTRTIEIDEFVDRTDIDPRHLIRPYYIRPDGKVGHDAFAVIRETIREMNKVAIGRVVLTNREHIIALEPMDKGLVGTLLRYPYEVRSQQEYFDEIQDVKVTKDMLDLAKHIVNQKAGRFDPEKFEDHYETALIDLINTKRSGKPITPKERPAVGNVVDLMEALRRSVGQEAAPAKAAKPAKKPRKAASGQKEMLMPIQGKKPKEGAAKKPTARPQRRSA